MNWKRWIGLLFISVVCFFVFLIATFPYERLSPFVEEAAEEILSQTFQESTDCRVQSFNLNWRLQLTMDDFRCEQRWGSLFELKEVRLGVTPFSHSFQAELGEGRLRVRNGFSLFAQEFRSTSGQMDNLAVEEIAPIFFRVARQLGAQQLIEIDLEGRLNGHWSLPLKRIHESGRGELELQLSPFRVPSQQALDFIGLPEITFERSVIELELDNGRVDFTEIALISDDISGKVEGHLELAEDFINSSGNIALKWKIRESDALRSGPMGMQLLNMPCPNPDDEGFCTHRYRRLSDLL